jgi:YT521-B-like domain
VPWASRSASPAPCPPVPVVSDASLPISPPEGTKRRDPRNTFLLEEQRVLQESPQSISPLQEGTSNAKVQASSAPAKLHGPHSRLIHSPQNILTNIPRTIIPLQSSPFELDADAPYRAMKDYSAQSIHRAVDRLAISACDSVPETSLDSNLRTVAAGPTKDNYAPEVALEETWGHPFCVKWIRTEHLSFSRTQHLRNPWNHGRKVQVSRDGTELEPSIGQQLLEEWDRPQSSLVNVSAPSSRTTPRRRAPKAA